MKEDISHLTLMARIKQLEENVDFWKKAHVELQNQFIRCKNKHMVLK